MLHGTIDVAIFEPACLTLPTMSSHRTGKTILLFLVICLSYNPGYAQTPRDGDLSRKRVSAPAVRIGRTITSSPMSEMLTVRSCSSPAAAVQKASRGNPAGNVPIGSFPARSKPSGILYSSARAGMYRRIPKACRGNSKGR